MHELGIMTGVMEAVEKSAVQAGATKVLKVTLSIGEMTEAIEDSLRFAFEVLTEGTMSEGAELEINMVTPRVRARPFPHGVPRVRRLQHEAFSRSRTADRFHRGRPARRLTSVSASLCRRSRGRARGRRFLIGRSRKATCIRRAFPIRFITETAA